MKYLSENLRQYLMLDQKRIMSVFGPDFVIGNVRFEWFELSYGSPVFRGEVKLV